MIQKVFVTIVLTSLLLAQPATGQHSFPYRLDSITEPMLLVGGTSLLLNGAAGQNEKIAMPVSELAKLRVEDLNGLDRIATHWWNPRMNQIREVFEPSSAILTTGGIALFGLYQRRKTDSWTNLKTLSIMYFEGLYLSTGAVAVSKSWFYRPRPYLYNQSLTLEERYRGGNNESFFSGNANTLFFHATFFSQVFSDLFPESKLKPWIWTATLGIAGYSAWLSVRSGMHFPTDVIAGAVAGSLTGLVIPALHRSGRSTGTKITPLITSQGGGVVIQIPLYRPIR
ncbi:MAG: phosphatase PAP2 family protein [Bacteroidales bacterium]|jgi:membrane-associated phospholipid phosphatase|nr:phosphatase PAP2 family protein [Bacteroidales bacterium]